MKSFTTFIAESFQPTRFPSVPASDAKRLASLCELLNKYETEPVPNPVFQSMKGLVSSVVEHTMDYHRNAPPAVSDAIRHDSQVTRTFDNWNWHVSYPIDVIRKLPKAHKAPKTSHVEQVFFAWYIPALEELLPLAQAMESMKARVFKRQPKPVEDQREKYIVPMAKQASGKLIIDALTKMTEIIYADFAKAVTKWMADEMAALAAMSSEEQHRSKSEFMRRYGWWEKQSGTLAWRKDSEPKKPVKNLHELLVKEGTEAADQMQQTFVLKNARKLASIIERKQIGLAKPPTIIRARAGSQGMFEGDMRLDFTDGSAFGVRNQVVFKHNQYGTFFMQYPTTFHDVVFSSGKKMGMPSEERMNTVFIADGAE